MTENATNQVVGLVPVAFASGIVLQSSKRLNTKRKRKKRTSRAKMKSKVVSSRMRRA